MERPKSKIPKRFQNGLPSWEEDPFSKEKAGRSFRSQAARTETGSFVRALRALAVIGAGVADAGIGVGSGAVAGSSSLFFNRCIAALAAMRRKYSVG